MLPGYRSPRIRGWIVTALCISCVVVALVGAVGMAVDINVQLDRLGGTPNAGEVAFADTVGVWWILAVFGLWLAGWIAFPIWLARVYANLRALGRTPRHTTRVAVAGALLPPVSFFLAAPVMEELSDDSTRSRQWAIVYAAYWLLTAGMAVLGFIANAPATEALADAYSFAWSAGGVALALVGYNLVRRANRLQEATARERPIDMSKSLAPSKPRLDFGPAEPIITVDVQPANDSFVIRPDLAAIWRRLRALIPILAFSVLVFGLQALRFRSPLGRGLVVGFGACIVVYVLAASLLFFRNAALFIGGGYFGRVNALGRRIAYPSTMLRAIVGREVRVGKSLSPRVIFVGPGGRVLFQITRTPWDSDQLSEFLDRLHVPMDDSEAIMTPQDLITTIGVKLPYSSRRWALVGGMTAVVLIVVLTVTFISR